MNTDHVVMDSRTQAFTCLHCGQSYKPALPCPIDMLVSMTDSFLKLHKHCKPSTNQPTQGENHGI